MSTARFARALLTAACLLLALPALASAATYTVNNTGDQGNEPGQGCGVAEGCSLRTAIELSNASTATSDVIAFSAAFDGQLADTIFTGPAFPAITDQVTVDGDVGAVGGQCATAAGVSGPCVGVKGFDGLDVQADGVSIQGLAINDASIAIAVEGDEFEARNDWIGIDLEAAEGGDATYGIFVAPNADKAKIGGAAAVDRNVFAYNISALVLRGASEAQVLGNYFGVEPDGVTPAGNDRDLVVANKLELSPPNVAASNNQIGADVGADGLETAACDFGCNVFASESVNLAAIDLQGSGLLEEAAATGPTQIEGNYVGLDATGAPMAEAAPRAINVGSADTVTVGGVGAGQANQIHGGGVGVFAGNGGVPAKDLVVEGNSIGRSLDGSTLLSRPGQGVFVSSEGLTVAGDVTRIVENSISSVGVAIEQHATGAIIVGNEIVESGTGIHTTGSTETSGIGNLIEENEIVDPNDEGILIENDFNEVFANEISSAGESGIVVKAFTTIFGSLGSDENLIGGDEPGSENTIVDSDADAIEIRNLEGTFTEIARNLGKGNGGSFIDIGAVSPGTEPIGPNGGIKPPTISTVAKTTASGVADEGALVRVFLKTSDDDGELGAFLGEGVADGSGQWTVAYAAVPGESLITATQTKEGGTSELRDPKRTPADPVPPCTTNCGPPSPPPVPDTTKPKVTIKKSPKAKSTNTTAKFKFVSDEAGSTFKCKLDKKAFANCKSPKTYKKLKPGKHVFKVKATDAAGNVSAVAKRKFTVLA
jgi:hypothetical protein